MMSKGASDQGGECVDQIFIPKRIVEKAQDNE